MPARQCVICESSFVVPYKNYPKAVCSKECERQRKSLIAPKVNTLCVCLQCGGEYHRRVGRRKAETCSRVCASQLMSARRKAAGSYVKTQETIDKAKATAILNNSWNRGVEKRKIKGSYIRSTDAVLKMQATWRITGKYKKIEVPCSSDGCIKNLLVTPDRIATYNAQFCSRDCAKEKHVDDILKARTRGRGKGGYREDIGYRVRSTWEANFIRILQLKNIPFEYEPRKYKLIKEDGSTTYYLPDFFIGDTVIEVKGFNTESIWKTRLLHHQYGIKIKVVDYKVYQWLENRYKPLIRSWE